MASLTEKLSPIRSKNDGVNPPEITDEIPEDPAPGQSRRRPVKTSAGRGSTAARKPKALPTKAAVRDELQGYLEMLALGWSMRCDACGGSLSDQSEKIADKLSAIIVRTPRLLEWFASGNAIGDYVLLVQAVFPVAKTAIQHRQHALPESPDDHANLAHFAPFSPNAAATG